MQKQMKVIMMTVMIAGEGLHSRCATNYPKRKRQSMMITNEISDDYEKRMNSMMKTVMIVGEGLGLGVQQMIHLILAPFSPHPVTIRSLTFFSFAFHAVFSTFQVPLICFGMG